MHHRRRRSGCRRRRGLLRNVGSGRSGGRSGPRPCRDRSIHRTPTWLHDRGCWLGSTGRQCRRRRCTGGCQSDGKRSCRRCGWLHNHLAQCRGRSSRGRMLNVGLARDQPPETAGTTNHEYGANRDRKRDSAFAMIDCSAESSTQGDARLLLCVANDCTGVVALRNLPIGRSRSPRGRSAQSTSIR